MVDDRYEVSSDGYPPLRMRVDRDAATFTCLAAGAFGLGVLVSLPLGRGLAGAVVAGIVGSALYLAAGRLLAPTQFAVLAGLRRMGSSARETQ